MSVSHVYIPLDITGHESGNAYDTELVRSLERSGIRVDFGLWRMSCEPRNWDVIHLQWPEYLIARPISSDKIDRLISWLFLAKRNSKIVLTVHNLAPHYLSSPLYFELYQRVFELVDGFIHLGGSSEALLRKTYRLDNFNVLHKEIPHGNYSSIGEIVKKSAAREAMGIDSFKPTMLVVGGIRHNLELHLILRFYKALRGVNGQLLFSCKYTLKKLRLFGRDRSPNRVSAEVYKRVSRSTLKILPSLFVYPAPISQTNLAHLLSASDILLIPRFHPLNSGNVPLGFSFENVVIGPNFGNVGTLLKKFGNCVFEPESKGCHLQSVIEDAVALSRSGKGLANKYVSDQLWSWDRVGELTCQFYREVHS